MRHRLAALLVGIAIVSAVACAGREDKDRGPEFSLGSPPARLLPPTLVPAADMLVAADPKLEGFTGWPIAFEYTPGSYAGGLACVISVSRDGAVLATLPGMLADGRCSATWAGRDAAGGWLT